nr:hypothetical protein [uncultured Allomuricauda sp.]
MKTFISILNIFLFSIIFLSFINVEEEENVIQYFVNPNLENINYRTFKSSNSLVQKMIFKQIFSENEKSTDGIKMEYIFMSSDSIPIYGGIEKINKDRIEVLEQYLVLQNRKIKANKIEGNVWTPSSDIPQSISIEFLDKETGYGIKSEAETFSRFKDTLGQKSFIVELKSVVRTYLKGQELQQMESNSKRWYVKNKGLIYHGEVTNGKASDYYLVENE